MPTPLRTLALPVLGCGLLAFFASRSDYAVDVLVDTRALVLVGLGPWIALGVTDSWRAVASTAGTLLRGSGDTPESERAVFLSRVRALGSSALAFAVLAAIGALVEGHNQIARLQGQAEPGHAALLYSGYLLGPLYALLLEALLYGPVRARESRAHGAGWVDFEGGA